jgi:hypothetical protein
MKRTAEVFPQQQEPVNWIIFRFMATANSGQGRRLLLGDKGKFLI